jgi:hypothetical protein
MAANATVIPPEVRRAAEARLARARQKLQEALAAKKAREAELVIACREDRAAVREHVREMRERALADVQSHGRTARAAAHLIRVTRLEEAKRTLRSEVERWRAETQAERKYKDEIARITREENERKREIHAAHAQSEAAAVLRLALFGKLGPLFEKASIVQVPGESRAEAVYRHAERNIGKVHAALEPRAEQAIAETTRAVAEAEKAVRAVGGNTAVRASRVAKTTKAKPRRA